MNIADLLDPEKMAELDKRFPTPIKNRTKKPQPKWEMLKECMCPMCSWMLSEKEAGYSCAKCDFFISRKKYFDLTQKLIQENND